MNNKIGRFVGLIMMLVFFTSVDAKYTETMDPKGLTKNMKVDYGLKDDNAAKNQSDKLRKAIKDVNAQGGGRIIIPQGTYTLSAIGLLSNVHILIEAGTVIKPAMEDGVIFNLTPEKTIQKNNKQAYIENVSIRGIGGSFIVDYHFRKYKDRQRAIIAKMVNNFLISDMDVKDNYSVYCGITLGPTSEKGDISKWKVSRATNGTIQNIRHFKAAPGYGLVQCHGAQSVHFENLYSLGGVSLRFEVGANYMHVGVYDITAKNLVNENGRCALMMNPHSAKCGVVTVDGITTISSTVAVETGDGHVKKNAPDQTLGWFDNRCSVKNVHAIFGTEAQMKGTKFLYIPDTKYYDGMKTWSDNKFFTGPSHTAVTHHATRYKIAFENVTIEGFPYNKDKPILKGEDGVRPGKKWDEKKLWEDTHKGDKWMSDKGVVNDDYSIADLISKSKNPNK